MSGNNDKNNPSSRATVFRVLRQISYTKLFKKYTSGNFSYHKILANNLVFNDTCRIVARFKDYLIFDDNTEFLRRFYTNEESYPRLERILTFYETYSKIFPNYMILKESKYLYRNIRKKQKMIDAVNEIKREEEENRKKIKQNNGKINKDLNELFTKTVKEEIKTFQENTTFDKFKNPFDSDNDEENESSISISVMNRKMFFENLDNKLNMGTINAKEIENQRNNSNSIIHESFVANETNHSISGILNVLNDNKIYINDLPKLLDMGGYSKNMQKYKKNQKNNQKNPVKPFKKNSPEKKIIKNNNNQLISSNNKYNKKNGKKYEISSKQNTSNKNTQNSHTNLANKNANSNVKGHHYLSSTGFKKVSLPQTNSGTVFVNNTEKNLNDINQYQNIIIPKGNTVININNNYFEQVASSSLQSGYYTNQNLKINDINNNNNNIINNNSVYKKSNTNTKSSLDKKSIQQKSFKKKSEQTNKNNNNNSNTNKNHHKQISEDLVYQKNSLNQKDKYIVSKKEIDEKKIKERALKFASLSPQPTINMDMPPPENPQVEKANNKQKNNYFTENNDPNLITGNTKENEEDEEDNKEREKLFFHIRDLIENRKKDDNNIKLENESNPLLLSKKKVIDNTLYYSNFSKYRTISNFASDNQKTLQKSDNEIKSEEKCLSNKNIKYMTNDNLKSINKNKLIDKENLNNDNKNNNNNNDNSNKKNVQTNQKQKSNNKLGFKHLPVKEKKNKTKGFLKKNNINNNNYNTSSKLIKEKNKNLFRKTNNNFKYNKKLFNNQHIKSQQINGIKTAKKNKLLNHRNNQDMKTNNSEIDYPLDKGGATLSHSILYRSPNSKLANLLMSQKKEDANSDNNTTTKIYHKGKIKNMKYKKDDLNLEKGNSSFNNNYSDNINKNNFTENSNTIIASNINTNANTNNNMNNTHKSLMRTHNINNSDLRNKYKSFLLKKTKQQSCEIDNQSVIQQKLNQELLERMNLIKQNNNNNFYQKYKENKVKLGGIRSYIGNNLGSFENLSNSNIITNMQNYPRNTTHADSSLYQTPSTENKKLGLYKKAIRQKPKLVKTAQKLGMKKGKNYETPSTIKVNRSKFLEKVKDKFFENNNTTNNKNMMISNFNSCLSHTNI